jgi:hypothetical protein
MRWFLGLVLVIALITGVLYGVGRFLLSNNLEVTRTISIDRPRAAVFAMVNDLRIAREWSPFYVRDPDADYSFSGDPGEGQNMRWVSNVREVGRGRMSIVSSTMNEEVQAILELGDRATLNSSLSLRPGDRATSVTWTMTAQCGAGAINVPCRYMNLIMSRQVGQELDGGLQYLKMLTERLPNVDFEGLDMAIDAIEPQNFVYVTVETSATSGEEILNAERLGLQQVRDFMALYNLTPSGPLVRVVTLYDQPGNRYHFRVGYPFTGAVPISVVGVQIGQTPSGQAMHVMFEGNVGRQRDAVYAQMDAYLQAHRIPRREGGQPWEVVHRPPDADGTAQLEIFFPLQ